MELDFILVCKLIIELFVFSCVGWMMEVSLKYMQYHRFINRGYLIGPYCPIYGWGIVTVTLLVGGVFGYEGTYVETFAEGLVACGALEYFVSWSMEKLFHARWWDYSKKPMNLNGRIWIGNLILFGLGSLIIIKFVNPSFFYIINTWADVYIQVVALLIILLFITDCSVSTFLMNIVKMEIDASEKDNTEEISAQIHQMLKDRHIMLRRINQAYPNLQARPKHLTDQLKEAKREMKEASKNIEKEIELAKENARLLAEQKKIIAQCKKDKLEEKYMIKHKEVEEKYTRKYKEAEERVHKAKEAFEKSKKRFEDISVKLNKPFL